MAHDSPAPASSRLTSPKSGPLDKFPSAVRDAHARFVATGDVDSLDIVVLAVLRDHQPGQGRAAAPSELPDSARLMGDLGFDSLALAEIVFFIEDLYRVSITNNELVKITTVGELRAFIRTKVSATRSSS